MLIFTEKKKCYKSNRRSQICFEKESFGESTCRKWFLRFKDNNFDLNVYQGPEGRQNSRVLTWTACWKDCSLSVGELVKRFNVLYELGKVNKVRKWVPHKMTDVQIHQHLTTYISLSPRQKKKSFLHQIVTEDESWVYYKIQMKQKYWLDPLIKIITFYLVGQIKCFVHVIHFGVPKH